MYPQQADQGVLILLDVSIYSTALKQLLSASSPEKDLDYYLKNRFLNQWLKWDLDPVDKCHLAYRIGFEDYILWTITPEIINLLDKNVQFSSACNNGFIRIVNILIQNGINNWRTGFNLACKAGHVQIVKLMISKGFEEFGNRFFEAWAHGNHWEFELGYSENIKNGFFEACAHGHLEVVKLLISEGYSKNIEDGFLEACTRGHLEVVKLLVSKCSKFLVDAVRCACAGYNIKVSDMRCNVELQSIYKEQAGISADSYFANVEVVKLIIGYGLTAEELKCALYVACISGCLEIVYLLIVAGAVADKSIMLACAEVSQNQRIVEYLNEKY